MMQRGVIILFMLVMACSNKDDVNKLNFLKRGNEAYAAANYARAIGLYNEALAVDSTFVDALNNRGLAEMGLGKNDEAIFSFNAALQIKPDYAEAQLNYVKANLAVDQYYASLDGLDALAKIWSDTSIIYFTRGLVYHEMAEDEKAMASFEKARVLNPENIEITINIANILYHRKEYIEAISLLKAAIAKEAGNPQAYNILAMCYAGLNDFENAATIIATAASLDGNDPYILNNQGFIALRLGEQAEAEKLFIKSMQRDPYNGWVYRNLALLRLQQEKPEEAVRLLGRAYEIDATIDSLKFVYADVLLQQKNYAKLCSLLETDSALSKSYQSVREHCEE